MKGRVELEFRDPKRGKIVHKEVGHNLVTNFFQEYCKGCGFLKDYPVDYSLTDMIGGILLFDRALPSDATNLRPSGVKMTGNAVNGLLSNDSVTEMGSFIQTDGTLTSGWQQDGSYLQMYEWATNQAIGNIGSVCLTSKAHGYIGEGNSVSGNKKTSDYSPDSMNLGTDHGITIDASLYYACMYNNKIYGFPTYIVPTETGYSQLNEYSSSISSVSFRTGHGAQLTNQYTIKYPDEIKAIFNAKAHVMAGITQTGTKLRYCLAPYTTNPGPYQYLEGSKFTSTYNTIYCIEIDLTQLTHDYVPTVQQISLSSSLLETLGSELCGVVCNENYVVLASRYKFVIFNRSNNTYVLLDNPDPPYNSNNQGAYNQVLMYSYGDVFLISLSGWNGGPTGGVRFGKQYRVDASLSRIDLFNYSWVDFNAKLPVFGVPMSQYPLLKLRESNSSSASSRYITISRSNDYLATIYNLDSVKQKTGDLALRVNYYVTF